MEMVYGVELTGMPLREYLLMLKENGLDTLPGTAAEILDDNLRTSSHATDSAQWRSGIRVCKVSTGTSNMPSGKVSYCFKV